MCTRVSQHADLAQIREQVGPLFGGAPNAQPRYNAAPTDKLVVVRRNPETGQRHADLLRWGLIPSWAKDAKIGTSGINARSETVSEKPMFRGSWQKGKRCLIPLDSFYEWQKVGKARLPYAIARADGTMMMVAGLWDGWRAPDGEIVRSFTVLTTEANSLIAALHNRMPVITPPEDYGTWLSGNVDEARALLRPCPAETLRMWPVSPAMNKAGGIDDPSCVEPLNSL